MKRNMLSVLVVIPAIAFANDWDSIPIPAELDDDQKWELQEAYSDSFNYNGKNSTFTSKWNDKYFHNWIGPGLTYWEQDESWVADGNLIISASRREGTEQVNAGVVTSKTKVKYPIFMEANIKVSNLELSSNFWLLSENDQREIDILEVYGGAEDDWFAKNMSTNFHVFFRNNDNTIKSDFNDQTHNTPRWGNYWRDGFHRFGAYWKSPTEVTFYIDGVKTPKGSWEQVVMKDKDYTGEILDKNIYNMDHEMFLILDTEDHSWRSEAGIIASDADLADGSKNKMYVDWIRVYKPVSTGEGNEIIPPSSATNLQFIHSDKCLDVTDGALWNGSKYQQWTCNASNINQKFSFIHVSNGEYLIQSEKSQLCVELKPDSSQWNDGAVIQQYICNSSEDNQLWTLFDKNSDTFELRNKKTDMCLALNNNITSNGGSVVQAYCDGGNNQRLKFK
ncbi:beta-agarase [Vibrio sp. SM6]|uniref:Beta-agarase n=1 Tax=Vibrio agarilyticus TaxID=2726741 RepID=A0A7X8TSV9_9VIBR|nr:RICIN domain-containing protein [Vibrio agarilyticus]NLS14193.1 beta-agarase [Vibrio agarilyticus]